MFHNELDSEIYIELSNISRGALDKLKSLLKS